MKNFNDYVTIINTYSESLKSKIIISKQNFAELVVKSIKYKYFVYQLDSKR